MKRKVKYRMPKHYDSLDAPVMIWERVHRTGDLSHLLLVKRRLTTRLTEQLQKVWENIYNEYLSEFGFSDDFISIKQKEVEIAMLKLQFIMDGDRSHDTFIEIAEIELNDLKEGSGKSDFMQTKIAIERTYKFQINMAKTSIREFYSYLKHLK